VLGRRLLAVTEARHWYDGKRDTDPRSLLQFWLHFESTATLMMHGHGDQLLLAVEQPYASYDMQQSGHTVVAPAQEPDLLASVVGQQLLNAAVAYSTHAPAVVAGIRLRFEQHEIFIATLADEWILATCPMPDDLHAHFTIGDWLNNAG
jgi:hypothetical protein